jgi:hypothetical protein
LDAITARALQANQLVDHLLRAADDLNIATERPVGVTMLLPSDGIARALVSNKACNRISICSIENRLVAALSLSHGKRSWG